jgi:hypothetical protein
MRQVFFDELDKQDIERLVDDLNEKAQLSEVEGLYWVEMPHELLEPDQQEIRADHPFCFAVEIGESWVKFELLLRSRSNFRSTCSRYAGPDQQRYILEYANRIIDRLELMT